MWPAIISAVVVSALVAVFYLKARADASQGLDFANERAAQADAALASARAAKEAENDRMQKELNDEISKANLISDAEARKRRLLELLAAARGTR